METANIAQMEIFKARLEWIAVTKLERDLCNLRLEEEYTKDRITAMAESLKRNGCEKPLTVRKKAEKYLVIDGWDRALGAREANMPSLPCYVVDASDETARLISFNGNELSHKFSRASDLHALSQIIEKNCHYDLREAVKVTGKQEGALKRVIKLLEVRKNIPLRVFGDSDGFTEPVARHIAAVVNDRIVQGVFRYLSKRDKNKPAEQLLSLAKALQSAPDKDRLLIRKKFIEEPGTDVQDLLAKVEEEKAPVEVTLRFKGQEADDLIEKSRGKVKQWILKLVRKELR